MSRTVAQKMGLKDGMRAFFLNAPASVLRVMHLPELIVSAQRVNVAMMVTQPKGDSARNAARAGFQSLYSRIKWEVHSSFEVPTHPVRGA